MTLLGLCFFAINSVDAATYYVRLDGGTPTQCTGTTNAPYPGSGNSQPCALNHPVWALGAAGTAGLLKGGDTLIIDDTNHATGAQAQYEIGYSMPNTISSHCSKNWTYDCVMSPIPSGPDAAHPTRILGSSYNSGCLKKPQLWGTDGVSQILNLSKASNVDVECMELTDHSNCGFRVGKPLCAENWNTAQLSGPYAKNGVYAQGGTNFSFTNLDVHGFAARGFLMGGINGITFTNVNMDGNYMSNWDSDVGESNNVSYNSGAIVLDHVKNRFAGCSEKYPRSPSFNTADYSNCTDQNANPPGYGDGFGAYKTGGNWVITNSEFSHNTQDGLDLLYHDGTGSVTIQRSLFEGNDGNQIKVSSINTDIENSVIISNCNYLAKNNKVNNTSSWSSCRAGGDAVVFSVYKGGVYKILNSTIYSDGNSNALFVNNSKTCNGTETYTFRNNIDVSSGKNLYINQLSGACLTAPLNTDYSIIYNVSGNTCPRGAHNKCATNPQWVAPISQSADSNLPNVALQSKSPAIGAGLVLSGVSSLDYYGIDRGKSLWSIGAINHAPGVTSPTTTAAVTTGSTTSTSTISGSTSSSTTSTTITAKPMWMRFFTRH